VVHQRHLWPDGWLGSDLWGKNRAQVEARIGKVNAQNAELEQTRQLLASSVARLYWEWQTQAAGEMSSQISNKSRRILLVPIASCISTG
jgi:hypothetical protein